MKIKELKRGNCINHPTDGYMCFTGLATVNPYTERVKIPHVYCFVKPVDENGEEQPNYSTIDGQQEVEYVEHSEHWSKN